MWSELTRLRGVLLVLVVSVLTVWLASTDQSGSEPSAMSTDRGTTV